MISNSQQSSPDQYNEAISKGYFQVSLESPMIKKILVPSFFSLIGDVSDKSIIDLGCGPGIYTRKLKKLTSKTVLGVDISSEMIGLCQQIEDSEKLGIVYKVHDLAIPFKENNELYDIGVLNFVLNHSNSFEMLKSIVKNAFDLIKPNGKIVGHAVNPDIDPKNFPKFVKYNLKLEVDRIPIQNYDPIHVELFHPDSNSSTKFDDFCVPPGDYERAFQESGFKNFQWVPEKLGKEFEGDIEEWAEYLESKQAILFEAYKI